MLTRNVYRADVLIKMYDSRGNMGNHVGTSSWVCVQSSSVQNFCCVSCLISCEVVFSSIQLHLSYFSSFRTNTAAEKNINCWELQWRRQFEVACVCSISHQKKELQFAIHAMLHKLSMFLKIVSGTNCCNLTTLIVILFIIPWAPISFYAKVSENREKH